MSKRKPLSDEDRKRLGVIRYRAEWALMQHHCLFHLLQRRQHLAAFVGFITPLLFAGVVLMLIALELDDTSGAIKIAAVVNAVISMVVAGFTSVPLVRNYEKRLGEHQQGMTNNLRVRDACNASDLARALATQATADELDSQVLSKTSSRHRQFAYRILRRQFQARCTSCGAWERDYRCRLFGERCSTCGVATKDRDRGRRRDQEAVRRPGQVDPDCGVE